MNDYRTALQTRYFSLLSNAVNVPVYDVNAVPSEPSYPHVIIGEWTEVDNSDKTSLGSDMTLTVRVVDRVTQQASRAPIYAICNQIKNAIRTRPVPFSGITGINVLTATLDDQITLPKELIDGFTYFGETLRFRHTIQQLS